MNSAATSTQPITKHLEIFAMPSVVWRVLTDPQEMKNWYFDIPKFEPVPGFQFQFSAGKDAQKYVHLCKVVEAIPNKKLSYTWEHEGLPGSSLVTFELEAGQCTTTVKFQHEGVESFEKAGPDFARESYEKGWSEILDHKLKTYLEKAKCMVEKEVVIDAGTEKVWKAVTDLELLQNWAKAFGEGNRAESTWEVGSEVLYKIGDKTCMKGVVTENVKNKKLKMQFYDDLPTGEFADKLGEYTQTWELEEQGGKTLLKGKAGPVGKGFVDFMEPLWDKAMPLVKETAESIQ